MTKSPAVKPCGARDSGGGKFTIYIHDKGDDNVTHIITVVKPKNGIMRYIHDEAIGAQCRIMEPMVPGEVAWWRVRNAEGEFTMHTSLIYKIDQEGDTYRIETKNTVYVLEPIQKSGDEV